MSSRRRRKQAALVCRMVSTGNGAGRPWPSPPLRKRNAVVLRFILGRLTELVPAAFPVELSIVDIRIFDGWCSRGDGKFEIMISGCLYRDQGICALLHEYAHALAWSYLDEMLGRADDVTEDDFEQITHGPAWGIAYSRVYQTYAAKIRSDVPCEKSEYLGVHSTGIAGKQS